MRIPISLFFWMFWHRFISILTPMNGRDNFPESHRDACVASFLKANPQVCPRKLRVKTEGGAFYIDGEVDSWFAKQVAQESIRNMAGIGQIVNRLEVTI
ncbi:MAG: BON domain-containing protein [Pirellulaceae bacterium]|nr:BON domain-containing protein [Pirellulaceae bacterium]